MSYFFENEEIELTREDQMDLVVQDYDNHLIEKDMALNKMIELDAENGYFEFMARIEYDPFFYYGY